MKSSFAARCIVRRALVLLVAAAAPALLFAQAPGPAQLAPYVTTATRTPAEPLTLGSAVEVIVGEDLARRQIRTLAGALGGAAGTPLFASGASGGVTSLFLRGANSNQTLFLVDGIVLRIQ